MTTLTIDKSKKWTSDDYQQLEEDARCEIIDAQLIMTPAPNTKHQKVSIALIIKLNRLIDQYDAGTLFHAPTDVYFDDKNVYQPDLVFIRKENLSIIKEKGIVGVPDLLVEIISPSNSYIDRYIKKEKYEEFGVKEYWIVDPANKTLEVYSLNEQNQYDLFLYLAEEGEVKSNLLQGFSFELAEIFK